MDLSSIQPLLDWLNLHQQWVAAAIVLIAFLESLALAGVVIPGVLLLFGASAVAGSGALSLWQALACAFTGAVIGDCTSFFLGKSLKQRIKSIWPFRKYPDWIHNGEVFFSRHGGMSIVIGRFVGPIRPVVPLVAGMLNMHSGRFVSINLVSALGWAPTYVIPGYLFGASVHWGLHFPEGFNRLLFYTGGIAIVGFLIMKLSHWHLSPKSRLYQSLQRWAERQHHMRLCWYWLAEPRDQSHTFPLTSLLLLLGSISSFVLLAYLVNDTDRLTNLNRHIFYFFQSIKHPWLDNAFVVISMLGDKRHIRIVAGIFALWLLYKRHYSAAIICVAAILVTEKIAQSLKHSFEIARPILNEDGLLSLTAFPSSHVTRATVLFGLLASYTAQEFSHQRRWWIYGIAFLPMLLVAVARLYFNQHWLTDVIGGFLVGLSICAISRIAFSRFNRRAIVADASFLIALLTALTASAVYLALHYG